MHWMAPPGTSLTEMTRITTRVSDELLSVPGVIEVASSLGRAVNSETIPGPYEGELWVSINPTVDYHQTVTRLQEVADRYAGVVHDVQTYLQDNVRHKLAETPDQITVRVYGSEEPVLREKAGEMAALVKEVPGVASALVGQRLEAPSIEIETDLAKVEQHGLKPGDVRRAASALLGRIQVGSLFQDQKVFNVVVWGKPEVRNSLTGLLELPIDTPDGGSVALGDVASVRIKPAELIINRDAVSRYVDVDVTVRNRDAGAVETDIQQALSQVKLPMEYHFEVQGRRSLGRCTVARDRSDYCGGGADFPAVASSPGELALGACRLYHPACRARGRHLGCRPRRRHGVGRGADGTACGVCLFHTQRHRAASSRPIARGRRTDRAERRLSCGALRAISPCRS